MSRLSAAAAAKKMPQRFSTIPRQLATDNNPSPAIPSRHLSDGDCALLHTHHGKLNLLNKANGGTEIAPRQFSG
ncbi:MAG: hypothetical protein KF868_17605 [Acidobacteria bacterium]|nr:hypothetical protein [Acidobacteriota bacterium]